MEEPTVTPLKFLWELLPVEGTPPTPRYDYKLKDFAILSHVKVWPRVRSARR